MAKWNHTKITQDGVHRGRETQYSVGLDANLFLVDSCDRKVGIALGNWRKLLRRAPRTGAITPSLGREEARGGAGQGGSKSGTPSHLDFSLSPPREVTAPVSGQETHHGGIEKVDKEGLSSFFVGWLVGWSGVARGFFRGFSSSIKRQEGIFFPHARIWSKGKYSLSPRKHITKKFQHSRHEQPTAAFSSSLKSEPGVPLPHPKDNLTFKTKRKDPICSVLNNYYSVNQRNQPFGHKDTSWTSGVVFKCTSNALDSLPGLVGKVTAP